MANCKCCKDQPTLKCNCDRLIKSLDFELLGKKINIPINKKLKSLGCYEYWYLGDATGYYEYDYEGNPTRKQYKNNKFKIEFQTAFEVDKFTLDFSNESGVLKYVKLIQSNNILFIESPDERLFDRIILNYNDVKFYAGLSKPELEVNFKNLGIPELSSPIVTDLSEELEPRDPLDIKNSANLSSSYTVAGGTIASEFFGYYGHPCTNAQRLGTYKSSCLTLDPINYSGNVIVDTFYIGFLIIFDFNGPQQIKVYPTYYTSAVSSMPDKIEYRLNSKNYISCCGCLPTDSPLVEHTPNQFGCPVNP